MKRTILAVKGIVKKLGSSVQSIRRAYTMQNAAVRPGTSSADFSGQRVVNDRTTTRRAIGGNSRRRAQQHRPRSVKRGLVSQRKRRTVHG